MICFIRRLLPQEHAAKENIQRLRNFVCRLVKGNTETNFIEVKIYQNNAEIYISYVRPLVTCIGSHCQCIIIPSQSYRTVTVNEESTTPRKKCPYSELF